MERRRSIPWLWVLATLGLIVIVGAVAYYLGSNHPAAGHPMVFARPIGPSGQIGLLRFGHGTIRFWLPVLLVALVVGVVVAAIARPSRPSMTFEEWHRQAHSAEGTDAHAHAAEPPHAGEDLASPGSADSPGSSGSASSSQS
jgi:hypothetical protein